MDDSQLHIATLDAGATSGHGTSKRITQGEPWAKIWSPFQGVGYRLCSEGAGTHNPGFTLGAHHVKMRPASGVKMKRPTIDGFRSRGRKA